MSEARPRGRANRGIFALNDVLVATASIPLGVTQIRTVDAREGYVMIEVVHDRAAW